VCLQVVLAIIDIATTTSESREDETSFACPLNYLPGAKTRTRRGGMVGRRAPPDGYVWQKP
jgi:hypothetical protein